MKPTRITKDTLIPIGLVLSLVTFLFGLGMLWEKVSATEIDIISLERKVEDVPTRQEYSNLQRDIETIKIDIGVIRKYILENR